LNQRDKHPDSLSIQLIIIFTSFNNIKESEPTITTITTTTKEISEPNANTKNNS
jgi:hypothetical protein